MGIIIKKKPNLEKYSVSKLYTTLTGKNWAEAKASGLTDGSYKQNMALREKLLLQVAEDSGVNSVGSPKTSELDTSELTKKKEYKKESKTDIGKKPKKIHDFSRSGSFGEAFNAANELLGGSSVFKYKGKMFTTNLGKAALEESEDWADLPVDDVIIDNSNRNQEDLTGGTTEDAVQLETYKRLNQYEGDLEPIYNRRASNKPNWIAHNLLSSWFKDGGVLEGNERGRLRFQKGGILPYKYKNGSSIDPPDGGKNKSKKKTNQYYDPKTGRTYTEHGNYSETPKSNPNYGSERSNLKTSNRFAAEQSKSGDSNTMKQMKAMKRKDDWAKSNKLHAKEEKELLAGPKGRTKKR